jgi:hypothetical protein
VVIVSALPGIRMLPAEADERASPETFLGYGEISQRIGGFALSPACAVVKIDE